MDETESSRERVIADLIENVEIAMGRKPLRQSVWRGGKLCQTEVFEHNGPAAILCLNCWANSSGMFKERYEFGVDRFSRMSAGHLLGLDIARVALNAYVRTAGATNQGSYSAPLLETCAHDACTAEVTRPAGR